MARAHHSRLPTQVSNEEPIIIAVMGETGAGKSEYIGRVTGEPTNVSDSLQPQARDVIAYPLRLPRTKDRPARHIRLLDCPGFDDGTKPDREIITAILDYLKRYYRRHQVHGIIYMIDITKPRMTGRSLVHLSIFRALCGEDYYANVVLGTTHWDELKDEATGEGREHGLKTVDQYWGSLCRRGSEVRRITRGNRDTASEADMLIIRDIANHYQPKLLRVQEEMDSGLDTSQTSTILELNEWQEYYSQLKQLKRKAKHQINQHRMQLRTETEREVAMMNGDLHEEELRFAGDQTRLRDRQREVQRLIDDVKAHNDRQQNGSPRTSDEGVARLAQEKHRKEAILQQDERRELHSVLQTCDRYGKGHSNTTSFMCDSKNCESRIDSTTQRFYREYQYQHSELTDHRMLTSGRLLLLQEKRQERQVPPLSALWEALPEEEAAPYNGFHAFTAPMTACSCDEEITLTTNVSDKAPPFYQAFQCAAGFAGCRDGGFHPAHGPCLAQAA